MSNQDASFGLRPSRTSISSQQQNRYRIASGYATTIYQGDLVAVVTGGGIERVAAGGSGLILGVFNGCTFVDSSGAQIYANLWTASTTGTSISRMLLTIQTQYSKSKQTQHFLLLICLATSILLTNLL
jgi:hypothetical protein